LVNLLKIRKAVMQNLYKYAHLPRNKDLISKAKAAVSRLYEKLTKAGVYGPRIDEHYRKRFYELHFNSLSGKLKNSAYHVLWAVAQSQKNPSDMSLIDHGGGLGFISLLAKELGVGRVIYNDIDAKFVETAREIARVASVPADQYITGDVDTLIETLGGDAIDTLVSYDVLEHVYNLDDLFTMLCNAPCCPRVLFMSSGANMFSPHYIYNVMRIQRGRELLNSCSRINIIRNYAPHLREEDLVLLCRKTRMLIRNQIEAVTNLYLETRKVELPKTTGANAYDPFGSNTVDPETGWWAEHLLNPFYLSSQLRKYGYTVNIKSGFYGNRGTFLNPIIRIAGVAALPIAPFYTVNAVREHCARGANETKKGKFVIIC
jgi:2-polyprenyl-3-methyl-5-hydroxy-6-metoxy-1,4-benzoquinol methylase